MSKTENNNNTLEFIQLVKCIIEYYGTTATDKNNIASELSNFNLNDVDILNSALNEISDFNFDELTIKIPSEIDEEIKKTFINQLTNLRKNV
jgi:hypothetical protein